MAKLMSGGDYILKSSGNYGEKFEYKLPHAVNNEPKKQTPSIEKDIYIKQEEQFEST
jgi:hypothetical protein